MKRILSLVLCALFFVCASLSVYAADASRGLVGSITATMQNGDEPIPGGTLTLYKVALYDAKKGYVLTETYAASGVELDSFGDDTAVALARFIHENNIPGEEKPINGIGVVRFDELDPALYLLIQWTAAEGYEHLAPFLVSIPNNERGELVYDVTCLPKQNPLPKPTPTPPPAPTPSVPPTTPPPSPTPTPIIPPPPTEPPGNKLPQTGQNHWLVPALAAAGTVCVILGAIFVSMDKRKQ